MKIIQHNARIRSLLGTRNDTIKIVKICRRKDVDREERENGKTRGEEKEKEDDEERQRKAVDDDGICKRTAKRGVRFGLKFEI